MEKFGRYSFPEIIGTVEDSTPAEACKIAGLLEKGDAALLVHMGRYFRRDVANALRGDARRVKQEYDNSGERYKTPLALRDITDPQERKFIFANIGHFGTTQGCSGGCKWCGVDSFSTNDIEVTPPQQVSHFFDEYVRHMSELRDDPAFIRSCMSYMGLYNDSDPFDDPNIIDILTNLYKKTGRVPFLSTTIPKKGEDAFLKYTSITRKHHDLANLKQFRNIYRAYFFRLGYSSVAEFMSTEERFKMLQSLKELYSKISRVKKTLVLSPGDEEALGFYGIAADKNGKIDDFENFKQNVKEKITQEEGALRFYPKKKERSLISEWIKTWDELFRRYGLSDLKDYYGPDSAKSIGLLQEKTDELEAELKDVPKFSEIRVSVKPNKKDYIYDLLLSKRHLFGIFDPIKGMRKSGKSFFDSGKNELRSTLGCGIANNNGMELSPFLLSNSVSGKVTHDFPQGRIVIPYKGLENESYNTAKRGEPLADILPHLIVIFDYWDGMSQQALDRFYVYDGRNIRRVRFSRRSYNVISDEVVKKDVSSLDDISRFNFRLREAKKISDRKNKV